ncbi:MAG: thiamine phosphate synthase [Pseudomonadota bacterium]
MAFKHHPTVIRKFRAAIRMTQTHLPARLPPLLFLTDPDRTPDPVRIARRLPEGSGVIYRHFGAAGRIETASDLAHACKECRLTMLVAADPDLALQVNADGVHWPEARLALARHWRGAFAVNTTSAHSTRALHRAAKAGMDAALFSAVFPSNSPSAGHPLGAPRFRILTNRAPMPVYALGGITARTAGRIASHSALAAIDGLVRDKAAAVLQSSARTTS